LSRQLKTHKNVVLQPSTIYKEIGVHALDAVIQDWLEAPSPPFEVRILDQQQKVTRMVVLPLFSTIYKEIGVHALDAIIQD